ncbi:MAG: hypothetical protein KAS32_15505 [Candidatus Peribacteraceae bacterium]|nr:hypothetical protein [Candidatus Peribacteraceae bacterium]
MELKEYYNELCIYTELINEIMPNLCCESAKEEVLGELLDTIFDLIEEEKNGTVKQRLKRLRVKILNDTTLSSEEKLKLQSSL